MISKPYGLLSAGVLSLAGVSSFPTSSTIPDRWDDPSPAVTLREHCRRSSRLPEKPGPCPNMAGLQTRDLEHFLPVWVKRNVQAAAAFVRNLPPGENREKALRILAQHWGEWDPESAITWASLLADTSEHASVIADVLLGYAAEHPADAVRMAAENQINGTGLLENLTQQWAETDPSAAIRWTTARPPGDERDRLLQRVTLIQSRTHPAAAANLALERIPPGELQIEALISILHQWGQIDPRAARAWALQFPEGDLRDRASAEVNGIGQ